MAGAILLFTADVQPHLFKFDKIGIGILLTFSKENCIIAFKIVEHHNIDVLWSNVVRPQPNLSESHAADNRLFIVYHLQISLIDTLAGNN